MNIFLSFLQSDKNYPIPAYSFWQYYLKKGIEEAGYQWVECPETDWALGLVPKSSNEHAKWKREIWERTVSWLKNNKADLFLSYLYPQQIDKQAIGEIQRAGIPCVNFFCDNVREFTKAPIEFKVFDLNWVPEFKALKLYQKAGFPYINLPMPVWISPESRIYTEEKFSQVTFIGSKDIQRLLLLEKLVESAPSLPLALYGSGWIEKKNAPNPQSPENYGVKEKIMFNIEFIANYGAVAFIRKYNNKSISTRVSDSLKLKIREMPNFDDYQALTGGSTVTLGINRYPSFRYPLSQPDTYSRLRDLEAPMLGACYLTEYTEGIEDLYDIDNEIAVYKTVSDLSNQIKTLMNEPEKRKILKINGQQRAVRDHSISNSLGKIFKAIG
jgi:Glycosyl transferases group 1